MWVKKTLYKKVGKEQSAPPPKIMPQYYLIELKSNSDSSDSFLIISSATKTASEIMQNHLNDSYTAVKMCDYLRHMSENEEKLVSKYWDEHPEERDAIFLHYCINDIYIDGMSRYSVFQPVDVFVGTILTAIISILLFARIINGLHPSLLRFLAPTWIKHDLHRKI